jgi:hypothetical protein
MEELNNEEGRNTYQKTTKQIERAKDKATMEHFSPYVTKSWNFKEEDVTI